MLQKNQWEEKLLLVGCILPEWEMRQDAGNFGWWFASASWRIETRT